ncbi:DNA-methyltransferase [Lascolabacillus massiliensis]|uniref:DNA-methyltransferase n=1 Tax=Lascolabacillus massiliensis TaxID=1627894 RepID=UPI0006B3BF6F|nr:site-specific DNA-methyltransferase [Lascolabacillus massiliensis]
MMEYNYILGDSLDVLKEIEDNKFKLIITSPPYNVGKEYEVKKSIELYLEEQDEIINELIRVLHPLGSICWQVGNFVNKGEVFPLDIFYYNIFKNKGLFLRNRIIWQFGHGLHSSKKFSGRYETILWFTKSDEYTFNLDPVRIPSKYPGKKHFKGPKKGQYSSNPKGKNPSDIWEIVLNDWENEIWNIPNVKSNHIEKTAHPCQYPIELVERCVLALTDENDWILDPYAGVGSTILASLKNNRKVVGIERIKKYLEIGTQRIEQFKSGNLKFRSIDTPIYDNKKSKLSEIPEEFKKNEKQ